MIDKRPPILDVPSEPIQSPHANTCQLLSSAGKVQAHHLPAMKDLQKKGRDARVALGEMMA